MIHQLDLSGNKDNTINELVRILNRQRPEPVPDLIDADPVADERVIDMHLIGVLNKSGDTTENNRIPALVSKAIPFIREYDDEQKIDAAIISAIYNNKILSNLIDLTKGNDPIIKENAVIVLNNLNLPEAPLGGDVSSVLSSEKIEFRFSHLKEEMELYIIANKVRLANQGMPFRHNM